MSNAESEVVMAVAEVVAENRRLRHQINVLNQKLIELSDPQVIRKAYRRGYHTGHSAGRRGSPAVTNPEACARGWMRAELAKREEAAH